MDKLKLEMLGNAYEIRTSIHPIGDGKWIVKVTDGNKSLFELTFSNGMQHEEADDLWDELERLVHRDSVIRNEAFMWINPSLLNNKGLKLYKEWKEEKQRKYKLKQENKQDA